jgi:hypothetical protein
MKNKKIIRLTENDIERLVKKIIAEGSDEEQKLINKTFDLLVGYGYYEEEELPQDLEELNDILWSEWQKSDSIMKKKFDDLMHEIEFYLSGYSNEENYDHLVDPEDDYMDDGEESPYGRGEDPHFRQGEESPYGEDDYMDDEDGLEWAKDSLKAKEGFDWLRHEPLDNLVGLRFEWDGNLYEVTDAFDASEVDEDGNNFLGPYNEDEEGVWVYAIDPETGDEYDEAMPLEMIVSELEDGNASLID